MGIIIGFLILMIPVALVIGVIAFFSLVFASAGIVHVTGATGQGVGPSGGNAFWEDDVVESLGLFWKLKRKGAVKLLAQTGVKTTDHKSLQDYAEAVFQKTVEMRNE